MAQKKWSTQRTARNSANHARAQERKVLAKNNGHPGVSPNAHNGKTQGGYTPEKLAWRAATRRTVGLTRDERSA